MSFNTALSGLQAASTDLNVTSNNIANVSTTGFKFSRSEFADIYAVSPFGNSPTAVGNGVQIDSVSQQFSQGNFEFTDNSLDLAISGQGFFVVSNNVEGTDRSYTRAGEFRVNADGYLTTNDGRYLQAFPVDSTTGDTTSTSLNTSASVVLPPSTGVPTATTGISIGANLNAGSPKLDPANFDPSLSGTYTNSTSTTVYDSLGESHVVTYYFLHDNAGIPDGDPLQPENQWQVFMYLGDEPLNGTQAAPLPSAQFDFNQNGDLVNTTPGGAIPGTGGVITTSNIPLANGAADLTISHDFVSNSLTTQYSSNFAVSTLNSNGSTTGRLAGLNIGEDGLIRANYTNGTSTPIGKVALADFPNSQGLVNAGGTSWDETTTSGAVIAGEAGTGRFGLIQSGALESSNVDLTQQLVNLITAQRNFQANARSIETLNTLTQTIIQIR